MLRSPAASSWDGPVIVKTELNARGAPEFYHNEVAALRGKPAPHPRVTALRDYETVRSGRRCARADLAGSAAGRGEVHARARPARLCLAHLGASWAGARPVRAASAPIRSSKDRPSSRASLSTCRTSFAACERRLGFDYGKFDFVLHDGRTVLFDANFTPTVPENLTEELTLSAKELALGTPGDDRQD